MKNFLNLIVFLIVLGSVFGGMETDTMLVTSEYQIVSSATKLYKDGSNNMCFEDAVTGQKTLAELSTGGGDLSLSDMVGFVKDINCIYKDTDTVTFIGGGFGECNGNLFRFAADEDVDVDVFNNGSYTYGYIDDDASSYPAPTIIWSTTAPTKTATGTTYGWYNGNDRCICQIYCDSASTIVNRISNFYATGNEYLFVSLSGDQSTNISANDPLKFNTVQSGSGIQFNTTTYRATLRAGVTYELACGVVCLFSAAGYAQTQWYDVTNSAWIGKPTDVLPVTHTANIGYNAIAFCIYCPATDVTVDCRILAVSNLTYFYGNFSWAEIKTI